MLSVWVIKLFQISEMSIAWVKLIPILQGTWDRHRYKTLDSLAGGNGQQMGHESVQNLPVCFKHLWWITEPVAFYSVYEEQPVLQQPSPGCKCQVTLNKSFPWGAEKPLPPARINLFITDLTTLQSNLSSLNRQGLSFLFNSQILQL